MKVLFLGSSYFSKVVLEKIIEKGVEICAVITQPDRPFGRGHKLTPTEVKVFAQEKGIDVVTFEKLRNNMEEIKKIDYDISLVASYGQILPLEFLEHKPCINVHPSLLPKYRGATPMQSALLNGDKVSGVTIMKVAEEVDAGDIILQKEVEIEDLSYSQLENLLAEIGGEMAVEVVDQYKNGKVKYTKQNHKEATFTKKISKADCFINFEESGKKIECKVRALGEEYGCYFSIDGQKIKTNKVKNVSNEFKINPCEILNNKRRFIIGCCDGAIEIISCMSPSGKYISGRDYINGHNNILGKKVENCCQI